MRRYSANYSYSNHNFVIQNLEGTRIDNEFLPAVCILKNILQRGCPTLLSKYLQGHLGAIHKTESFKKPYPLISNEAPKWERIIRGDVQRDNYPAKRFFEELLPKHLSEYRFIQQLIVPEVPINTITQVEVDGFNGQQVDFYLPQAYLIIEIDGAHHDPLEDEIRDQHTESFGIKTIRITTNEVETENESFKAKIQTIKERVDQAMAGQENRRIDNSVFIPLVDYKRGYEEGIDLSSPFYQATAIIRFQLLVLELLENGILDFSNEWKFELLSNVADEFAHLAIEDLFFWLEPILKLHKIDWSRPNYSIAYVDSPEAFSTAKNTIKVDFSLCKRYTDEFRYSSDVLFVRTDYLDEYRYFPNTEAIDPASVSFQPYDYFNVATTEFKKYELKFGGDFSDEKNLLFLLENIFLQDKTDLTFNEGQLPIIANALSGNHTIGLLPTGSGKSVCYQLAAILQPAISFVVCPIKSLMYDQKADLDSIRFTRVNLITSDNKGPERERIQKEFGDGKYMFIFISPERFQTQTFRDYLSTVNSRYSIAYAVIDEVHCLSEWGHDFRTSYLNLASTIKRFCGKSKFIALTATASLQVLNDIKNELDIHQSGNIKTLQDYTRPELDFDVMDDGSNKRQKVVTLIEQMDDSNRILTPKNADSRCGIIFTQNVNGSLGCYDVAKHLQNQFEADVRFYSGSVPVVDRIPIMTDDEFDKYRKNTQDDFKANEFTLLTATKAFGMGVNKLNIHYTIHYGIPGSMEALYQEGGRAGRDKEKFKKEQAKCYILFTKSTSEKEILDKAFKQATPFSAFLDRETVGGVEPGLIRQIDGDLNTSLFHFSRGQELLTEEFQVIKNLHDTFSESGTQNILITGVALGINKAKAEKAIYRLSQLGIIKDWVIAPGGWFGGGIFNVEYSEFDSESIRRSLLQTIRKYDSGFSFAAIETLPKYATYKKIVNAPEGYSEFDKYLLILLQWSYDNFAYNRRQSLKSIYENCVKLVEDPSYTKEDFKRTLENYFKFNESSYVLQHIAENPRDIERWFEVFYENEKLLTDVEVKSLRDNLSRFLESYMYNPGLDMISGLVRLWLDDYENVDGKSRFESSLEEIQRFEQSQIEFILTHILKLGKEFSTNSKNGLAESLYKFFNDESFLYKIQSALGDDHSLDLIVRQATVKVNTIKNRIYG
ncbi:MAG: RecQ family ATP-dependent DNA helicase [Flavobacteriales bacterium]|nr:RecQ family ATP-dependent DNA helicase [Flavobacteriales bacterium]